MGPMRIDRGDAASAACFGRVCSALVPGCRRRAKLFFSNTHESYASLYYKEERMGIHKVSLGYKQKRKIGIEKQNTQIRTNVQTGRRRQTTHVVNDRGAVLHLKTKDDNPAKCTPAPDEAKPKSFGTTCYFSPCNGATQSA